jgi:eukaryotic-like serine/threonine-protein kinase
VARFESERQALALMDHPAIAKVFEAGFTPEGRPYFAMEYVAGTPITTYCDRHKLTTRQRMELFIQVCEGVQHAHQKAIIHRDLKPSNILVSEVDGKPMPRIIDFGLAKATSQRLTAGSVYTRVGAVLGTLEYMSPEQADSGGEDIDTRTDVYSLGVVLYQLLAGALPLDLKKLAFEEVLRRLREQDVPRPSSRILTQGGDSAITAQNRGTDPPSLTRQLRGDPDAVVLKALEKDRKRRYGSPSELAADLGRYLRNEPVAAHAPSTGYRARKYIRRHRLGVAISTVAVLLLAGAAVTEAVQLRRITQERDRATRERDRADRITDFMTGMFKVSDPSEARGNSITARAVLDKASKDIDTGLAKDPELQATLINTMGRVYGDLGLYAQAESLFSRAIAIDTRVLGPENPSTLTLKRYLAAAIYERGRYTESEKVYTEVIANFSRVLGRENPETLKAKNGLGWVLALEGRYPDAAKVLGETVASFGRVLGTEHPDTLRASGNLATVLMLEGRYPDAEHLLRQTIDAARRVLGPDDLDTLTMLNNLGWIVYKEGRFAESESLERQAYESNRRVLGPDHPLTLASEANLADALMSEHHYAEAEEMERGVLDSYRRALGADHPDTLSAMNDLANLLASERKYTEAEAMDRETLAGFTRVLGPEAPRTLTSMQNLANALNQGGQHAQAEKVFRETLALRTKVLGPEHPSTALSTYGLACAVAHEGRPAETLELLRQAIDHGLSPNKVLGIEKDGNFQSLHGDQRFTKLVAYAKHHAASSSSK